MRMIAVIGAALLLGSAGAALAQTSPAARTGDIVRPQPQAQAPRPDDADSETVEVANPFTEHDAAPQLVKEVRGGGELTFGPYDRPQFARAPIPDFVPGDKGAVGLAFSMKLGRR